MLLKIILARLVHIMEELTEEQIRKGFWYWDQDSKFPPKPIIRVENYHPKSKLNLSITQLDTAPKVQSKMVEQWCELLPSLADVKYLWLSSKVSQNIFDAVCKMPNLEGLYIKWSSVNDIAQLKQLKHLKHLHFGSSAQVESIDALGDSASLVTLEIENFKKIVDFSPISKLVNLQGLGIDGSIWTTQKLTSLKPVESLSELKYLTLLNTKILDKSFDPILNLKNLVRFVSSWNYPETEFQKLKSLPKLKYGNVETSLKEVKEKAQRQLEEK
jgi:Leucine-rich repeat (LRR) protein